MGKGIKVKFFYFFKFKLYADSTLPSLFWVCADDKEHFSAID